MFKRLLYLLILAIVFSGCFIFRPKNRCADCPGWGGKKGHAQVKVPKSNA